MRWGRAILTCRDRQAFRSNLFCRALRLPPFGFAQGAAQRRQKGFPLLSIAIGTFTQA